MSSLLIILATVACTLCVGGIYILLRYVDPSRSRRSLIVLLAIWFCAIINGFYRGLSIGEDSVSQGITVLDIRILLSSFITIYPLILYVVSTIDERVLLARNVAKIVFPPFVVTIAYFGLYLLFDLPCDVVYHSFVELWMDIDNPMLWLRIVMLLIVVVYFSVTIAISWRVAPMLQRISGVVDGVKYVRRDLISLALISLAYLGNVLCNSQLSIVVYILVGIFSFVMIVDCAMLKSTLLSSNEFGIRWSSLFCISVVRLCEDYDIANEVDECDEQDVDSEDDSNLSLTTFNLFTSWLSSDKPFCDSAFSIKDVEAKFSEEQLLLISKHIRTHWGGFQSYIRLIRVEEAVRIIAVNPSVSTTQLADMVGFSHISSFTRAFIAVIGCTPSAYKSRKS